MIKPLNDIRVLDLSHRLPGPMAGYLLAALGAEVTKWEDQKFRDPFKEGLFKEIDPSFSHWYNELNKNKKIVIKDFKSPQFSLELKKKIISSDIVLMGLPKKLQEKFGVTEEILKNEAYPTVILKMKASHEKKIGLHDLNILALKNLIHLHVRDANRDHFLAPPFLPIAGIGYGQTLALHGLAWLRIAKQKNKVVFKSLSLEESVEENFVPFFSNSLRQTGQDSFLHNGRYPCYGLYPLKDKGWLAVACLEEKYWLSFTKVLNLSLNPEERFHFRDRRVFSEIEAKVSTLEYEEANFIFKDIDACVTPCL